MTLFISTAALGILAYYFWTRGDDKGTEETDTKGTANRDRRPGRQQRGGRGKIEGPQVHRQKVETEVRETLQRARARAEDLLKKDEEKTLAWESYFLSESARKMFSSEEFFGGKRRQPDSYRTALEAAENARDRLISRRKEAARQKEMAGATGAKHVGNEYVKSAVESALVVSWCAGGLVGRSRHQSAQEAFCVSVSVGDVQDWDRFNRILRKERERCIADSRGHSGLAG